MRTLRWTERLPWLAAAVLLSSPVLAAPPSPIEATLFAFPGQVIAPATARSAGLAMGERWLGDDPYANPAARARSELVVSPALVRVSRQDLRAGNRNYDETPAFIDGAGLSLSAPWRDVGLWLYGHQSGLRLEDNAFESGRDVIPPAVITSQSELRELRLGVAASQPLGPLRAGLGAEWTYRSDLYQSREQSGSPQSGERRVEFSGSGIGGQAGLSFDVGDSTLGGFSVGAAARYLPALALTGEQQIFLLIGDSVATVEVERESGWEAGVTTAVWLSAAFRAFASVGGHTPQDWPEFGVTRGSGFEWKLAAEFHDARDPWTLRFGFGHEQQSGVPEPRAGVFGLGAGWQLEGTTLDVGAVRRTFRRAGEPNAFDDRVIASLRIAF
ncbi:MAG TPA: hypothetical protein VEY91_05810 [Candidatus Limnocylindria bacterium]|nr:hypothetical protein [Candidatus Limnocylindria bacterium]